MKKNVRCYNCNRFGHISRNCPNMVDEVIGFVRSMEFCEGSTDENTVPVPSDTDDNAQGVNSQTDNATDAAAVLTALNRHENMDLENEDRADEEIPMRNDLIVQGTIMGEMGNIEFHGSGYCVNCNQHNVTITNPCPKCLSQNI